MIEAPKNFRRCRGVALKNVNFSNAAETLWICENVELDHVTAKGDYFAMNSRDMVLRDFRLVGNIPFCLFLVWDYERKLKESLEVLYVLRF